MGLILLVVACAALVGRLCGGRLARLGGGTVRGWRLLVISLLVELAALGTHALGGLGLPAGAVNWTALVVCGLLLSLFGLANRNVQGVALVGLGLVLNVLVIGLNGAAMPVSLHALRRAGVADAQDRLHAGFGQVRHVPAGPGTVLRPLGDVVPVPLPGRGEADSIGDVLVAAGAAQFVLTGMLGRAGRSRLPRPARGPVAGSRPAGTRPGRRGPARRTRSSGRSSVRSAVGAARAYRERGTLPRADSELVRVIPAEDELGDED